MFSKPGILLRTEGVVVFALSLFLHEATGAHWWIFCVLFLWPDLFMLGYLASPRIGAPLYNLVHTYIFPLALGATALHEHKAGLYLFALIWAAHIGIDRALGFGLKYPTYFRDTHLQHVSQSLPTAIGFQS